MIAAIVERVLRFRLVAGILVAACVVASVYAALKAPLDAIPDISDPQIIIYAKWPRSPQLLESQVTEPVVKALAGSPDIQGIRATSHMGYSFIYVVLKSDTRRAEMRQFVADRLGAIRPQLPEDAVVTVGPNASSMGWIYQYALIDRKLAHDPREMRILNDNVVKPALQSVAGVAEVASVGGLEKQYQLKLFPPLLAENGISLKQLSTTLQGAFQEAGGRVLEVTNRDYQIRGTVANDSVDKIELMVVGRNPKGQPIHLKDIGYIQIGYDQRRGIADLNGEGEVVGGIVVMEQKRNVLEVTAALDEKLAQLKASLPAGRRDCAVLRSFVADLGDDRALPDHTLIRTGRRHSGHRAFPAQSADRDRAGFHIAPGRSLYCDADVAVWPDHQPVLACRAFHRHWRDGGRNHRHRRELYGGVGGAPDCRRCRAAAESF